MSRILNLPQKWATMKWRFDWPVGRDGHASCVLSDPLHSQILVSGGWDKDNRLIKDAWILNVQTKSWKKVCESVCVCTYLTEDRKRSVPFHRLYPVLHSTTIT